MRFSIATQLAGLTLMIGVVPAIVNAAALTFSFTDPVGDGYPNVPPFTRIDLTGMRFTFDNTTGTYETIYTADPSKPFLGRFRLNTNLFNPDTGSTAQDPSFFSDTFNDYDLSVPTTSMRLTGVNLRLLAWEAGDRVAASGPNPLGLPDSEPGNVRGFGAGVMDLDLMESAGYFIGDNLEGVFTVIGQASSSVPAPGAIPLIAIGASLLGWLRRRRAL